jgi:hypothetical protein
VYPWTVWRREKSLPLPRIERRPFSPQLYRLSYPGSQTSVVTGPKFQRCLYQSPHLDRLMKAVLPMSHSHNLPPSDDLDVMIPSPSWCTAWPFCKRFHHQTFCTHSLVNYCNFMISPLKASKSQQNECKSV